MKTTYQIEVTDPCSENWGDMKSGAKTNTKFCDSCVKNVTDFTGMGNREVLKYLSRHPNTCGRFRKDQLGIHEKELFSDRFYHQLKLIKAGIVSLLLTVGTVNRGIAQENTTVGETALVQSGFVNSHKAMVPDSIIVAGVVSDENGERIPGVNIFLKGRLDGTISDVEGRFRFPIPLNRNDTLVFSFIGFETKEIILNDYKGELDIKMNINMDTMVLGGVGVLMGEVETRRFLFMYRWWNGFMGIFR